MEQALSLQAALEVVRLELHQERSKFAAERAELVKVGEWVGVSTASFRPWFRGFFVSGVSIVCGFVFRFFRLF